MTRTHHALPPVLSPVGRATPADATVRARALGAAVAYGRVARAVRASPYTLSRIVRNAPAADDAARRACVWAALGAYFGAARPVRAVRPARYVD